VPVTSFARLRNERFERGLLALQNNSSANPKEMHILHEEKEILFGDDDDDGDSRSEICSPKFEQPD